MLKQDFAIGPFTIAPIGAVGPYRQRFSVSYNAQYSAEIVTDAKTQREVADAASESIAALRKELRAEHEDKTLINLTDNRGEVINGFYAAGPLPDMSAGLIDDRSTYWLKDESGLYSLDVNLTQYAQQRAAHELPRYARIADGLSGAVLTTDAEQWRAPTAWENSATLLAKVALSALAAQKPPPWSALTLAVFANTPRKTAPNPGRA